MQKKFSYPVKIDELKQSDYKFLLKADAQELVDIQQILQVEKVYDFCTDIRLKLDFRIHQLKVWGRVKTKLEVKSVISLENFVQEIDTPFELVFDTKASYQDIRDMKCSINDDVPDIIENGCINLADIALEQAALKLDDYPRMEGETFDFGDYVQEPIKTEEYHPFAVLAKLKK